MEKVLNLSSQDTQLDKKINDVLIDDYSLINITQYKTINDGVTQLLILFRKGL